MNGFDAVHDRFIVGADFLDGCVHIILSSVISGLTYDMIPRRRAVFLPERENEALPARLIKDGENAQD